MASVSGNTIAKASYTQAISAGLVSGYAIPVEATLTRPYGNGTGAYQTDLLHAKQYVLVASTPQTLDLTAVTDPAGGAVNFARVREVVVQNLGAYPVTLGAAAATPWTGLLGTGTSTLIVPPGASVVIGDPFSAGGTAGMLVGPTSKSLKIDPGANAGLINLVLVGCSATS